MDPSDEERINSPTQVKAPLSWYAAQTCCEEVRGPRSSPQNPRPPPEQPAKRAVNTGRSSPSANLTPQKSPRRNKRAPNRIPATIAVAHTQPSQLLAPFATMSVRALPPPNPRSQPRGERCAGVACGKEGWKLTRRSSLRLTPGPCSRTCTSLPTPRTPHRVLHDENPRLYGEVEC